MRGLFVGPAVAASAGHAPGWLLWVAALAVWAVGLCLLAWSDLRKMVVPTWLVRLTEGTSGALFVGGSLLCHDWRFVELGACCGAMVGAALASWSLLRPKQLGFGDARAGALMAFGAGAVWPAACLAAVPAACLAAGLGGKACQVAKGASVAQGRKPDGFAMPLVPFLALGGLVVVVAGAF